MILDDIAAPVKGHQAEILRELVDHGAVTVHRLIDQLYGSDPNGGPDNAVRTVQQHVHFLRKKIKPGWRILSVDHNGVPVKQRAMRMYRLEHDNQPRQRWT